VNKERAARAYNTIAEGFAELALAILDEPQAAVTYSPGAAAARGIEQPRPLAPADDGGSFEEDPQFAVDYEPRGVNVQEQHVNNVLSKCPKHDRPWEIKPAGVSKAGKSYGAFYKCGAKDPDTRSGYCDKKPVKAWLDAHPIAA
jgi:hypothetical protein